ncbi:MAG: nucleotidyltransferase domain-containing protein [Treponema sp.]|nr:nucleotidyltransferase domain-containing protein [Treponema sp.]
MNKSIYSLEDIKNKLSPVFLLSNVKSAVLFGSYAKGYATENSDIDLLVDSNLKGLKFFALF